MVGRAERSGRVPARIVAAVVLAVLCAVLVRRATAPSPSDHLLLGASDFEFSTRELHADAGRVEVAFANTDAVPHTFTIPELGVDAEVGGGEARRITFDAEPGTYRYVCTIPGHDTPGMRGVLTVTR